MKQFTEYLQNQLSNPFIEEDEKMPFSSYEKAEETLDLIPLRVSTKEGSFQFDYNCYFVSEEGNSLFSFQLVE